MKNTFHNETIASNGWRVSDNRRLMTVIKTREISQGAPQKITLKSFTAVR